MAGYSSTPLPKKLGIKEGSRIALINAPADFQRTLGDLPANVVFTPRPTKPLDILVLFVLTERALLRDFAKLATANGVRRDRIAMVSYQATSIETSAPVRLVYTSILAVVVASASSGLAGLWQRKSPPTGYGCSSNVKQVAMAQL